MLKKAIFMILLAGLVTFFVQNTAHVPIVFLSQSILLRSIFLILICILIGFFAGYYIALNKEASLKVEVRKLKFLLNKKIFSKILIAKKGKKRGEINYVDFAKKYNKN